MRRIPGLLVACLLGLTSPAAAGPRVEVSRENPHYLAVDGVPVFLIGATHQYGWMAISRPGHDFRRDLDRLAATVEAIGSPHVRGLVRVIPYFPQLDGHQPWRQGDDGRYDLARFDPHWAERLRALLDRALGHGLVVAVEIWEDWSITRGRGGARDPGPDRAWNGHPFNPRHNVNYGAETLPVDARECDAPFYRTIPALDHNRTVLRLQERYVERLLSITAGYPNVLYSLSNESRASLAWSRYWADFLRARLGPAALIGDMPSTNRRDGRGECDAALNPLALIADARYGYVDVSQAVSRHEFGPNAARQALAAGQRLAEYRAAMRQAKRVTPLVVSKDYTITDPEAVAVLWSKFVGGAAAARFHRPPAAGDPRPLEDFLFETIERLGRFVGQVAFWTLAPDHDVVVSAPAGAAGTNALGRRGEEYVVQVVGGRGGDLELRLPPGRYRVWWFDPRTGRFLGPAGADGEVVRVAPGHRLATPGYVGDLIVRLTKVPE
jgi:hypothetical protein